MKFFLATLIFFAAFSVNASVSDVSKKAREIAEREWKARVVPRLQKTDLADPNQVTWSLRVSDPIPREWPPFSGHFLYYAHARGRSRMFADIEIIGPVWAIIDLDPSAKAKPALTEQATRITKLGMQGLRPLTKQEKVALDPKVMELLTKKKLASREEGKLRGYYATQRKLGNVPEFAIDQNHDFFSWVENKDPVDREAATQIAIANAKSEPSFKEPRIEEITQAKDGHWIVKLEGAKGVFKIVEVDQRSGAVLRSTESR